MSFFFAGGGTGGHLYPAIAVAEQLCRLEPQARILFFCSSREIDQYILSQTEFEYSVLPAKTFPSRPGQVIDFIKTFRQSYKTVAREITKSKNSVLIGLGGFASGPSCWAAHRKKVPLALFNVDIIPGKANQIIARWASDIFVQFEDTSKYFNKTKAKINVFGCPLRSSFLNPEPQKAIEKLGLEKNKKILLITGASSGSQNINDAICLLLEKLDNFAQDWQIVHLAGRNNPEKVTQLYEKSKINHKVHGYFDDMPDLLAAADLVIGRSGAVSVAEFAVAGVPSICIPYPYHKDRQQYLNAQKLVEAGAAVIVDDIPDKNEFSQCLWRVLEGLLKDHTRREKMSDACKKISNPDASSDIAKRLIEMANPASA